MDVKEVKENSGNWSLIFCTQGKWCAGVCKTKIMQKWSIKILYIEFILRINYFELSWGI
jgi:hypothetical protein